MRLVVNLVAIGVLLGILGFSTLQSVGGTAGAPECRLLFAELQAHYPPDLYDMGMNWIGCDHQTLKRDVGNPCERVANRTAHHYRRTTGSILPHLEDIAETTEARSFGRKRCVQWEDGSYSTQ